MPRSVIFWGTYANAELDLLIVQGDKKTAFEFKYTSTPRITRSMHTALADLELDEIIMVCPGTETYSLSADVKVTNLQQLTKDKLWQLSWSTMS